MATLTIADLPENLLGRLQDRAAEDRRSLDQELVHLLEWALAQRGGTGPDATADEAEAQYQAWCRLGVWQSDRPADEEIRDILSRRTGGRSVEL